LRRAWRVMTWPLSGHMALALGTGLACGIAASQANAYAMIRRRAVAAGIETKLGKDHGLSQIVVPWRRPPPWRTMPRRARRGSMIGGGMRSPSMRSRGSQFSPQSTDKWSTYAPAT
jgi:hypothetical protein